MNREIKFRAWHKNKMIEINSVSYFIEFDGSICKNIGGESYDDLHYLDDVFLMQYTGLKDRNEKEIYEGDILKYVDNWEFPNEDDTSHHLIYWDKERARFTDLRIEDGDSLCSYEDGIDWISDSKIVGNKFENPELLKS